MCNTLQLKHTVSEAGGNRKAEIIEHCCYVCTEQTKALYTGNCTLICIIYTAWGGRRNKSVKIHGNKMWQEKAKEKRTGKVLLQVILSPDLIIVIYIFW